MRLISLQKVSLSFGGPLIFDDISFKLERGERVALIGRNGVGKTTFLKVMAGEVELSDGKVLYRKDVNVASLPQEVPGGIEGTVFDVVLSGLGDRVKLLSDYQHFTHRLQTEHSPELIRKIAAIQSKIDHIGAWDLNNQVENVISKMKLDPEAKFDKLSGGQKRRALLARALVIKPDVLLLDEPTNHLDIDSINWLEEFLKKYTGSIFFITHDRMFMRNLATRIALLDRGKMFSWECDYKTFLERRQAILATETVQQNNFDKKLAKEEIWIRRGVKARRCRDEGRVKALERLREEKKAQQKELGLVRMKIQKSNISGHLALKAGKVGFSYGDNCLINDFSVQIKRGEKVGILGPNGSGKTTLIKIFLGEILPERGKVRLGTNTKVVYYDQLREQLDMNKTVAENVCSAGDTVEIDGKPRNVIGYLQDFLFSPERARSIVKVLSGGERNRLLLAKLFTQSFNLLVMDEPTNDLDVETLELLEELLLEYPGTLFLVSHDRTFLNNVVTSTIVIEGEGVLKEYPGGYDDWLDQRKTPLAGKPTQPKKVKKNASSKDKTFQTKLTFKEKKEFEELIPKIEKLEEEKERINSLLTDSNFYKKNPKEIAQVKKLYVSLEEELQAVYERWEYLDQFKDEKQKSNK
ncbi:MAG: ATP-binding cassette domain-containing protein [Candidatus Omnitrophota bacterium]|nr:ATP-binding cassette domain-containing protein [Candidatus Omnitrophota bacterium]